MTNAIKQWTPSKEVSSTDTLSKQQLSALTIAVVGAGPVGVRFVHELKRLHVNCQVLLFGNEPYELYNRVQLSNVLARDKDYADIVQSLPEATDTFHIEYVQCTIETILPDKNQIETDLSECFSYDQLVLATGSKPHVPNIEGANLTGVYTFRNFRDTEALLARSYRSRRTIVVGGGLLGLEAARALSTHNTEVHLLQQADRLMNRQLDDAASELLEHFVIEQGILVSTNSGVRKVLGDDRVSGVVTRDGQTLECDTVLFCTGIKPEIALAVKAGIKVDRGIVVNSTMQTNLENIYAIGECSEHEGVVYGLVAPGLEQASVLANRFAKGDSHYQGTQLISTLKVVGQSVCSMGEVAEITNRAKQSLLVHYNKKTESYRKLVIHQGRIIGACSIGEWPENRRIQEAFLSKQYIFPWQRWWFRLTGDLWWGDSKNSIEQWPEDTVICQCNQIQRGTISTAINNGCQSIDDIGHMTSAGTVCGSCRPLLQHILGDAANDSKLSSMQGAIPLFVSSIIAMFAAALFIFFPGFEPVTSVQTPSYEFLWTDSFWKQVSGFTMLGLVALGLLMSLRKRAGWKFLGNFSYWRLVHTFLGLIALGILLAHTGGHLGENLNRWLMLNFLLISALGALAGMSMTWASKNGATSIQSMKKSWFWAHLIVAWPLPALLAVHILSVYFF